MLCTAKMNYSLEATSHEEEEGRVTTLERVPLSMPAAKPNLVCGVGSIQRTVMLSFYGVKYKDLCWSIYKGR